MAVSVHRMFVILVLALVAALVMPLAAGAVVLTDDDVLVDEGAVVQAPVLGDVAGLFEEPEVVEFPDELSPPASVDDDEQPDVAAAPAEAGADHEPGVVPQSETDAGAEVAEVAEDEADDLDGDELVEASSSGVGGAATHIAGGHQHSLYLDGDGQIWAWGSNEDGELGNGTTVASNVPVRVNMGGVLAGVEVVAVAAGGRHSMALDSQGRVYSWGRNADGALGDGSTTNRTTPVRVAGLLANQRVSKISAGGNFFNASDFRGNSAALGENGRVYTWGSGVGGRLGNGTTTARQTTPVLVAGLIANLRVTDLSVGSGHTVVLTDAGRIFSWGNRREGNMGNGVSTTANQTVPVAATMTGVLSGVRIVQVQARGGGTAVLSDDGQVFGWGDNANGELGNGTRTRALVPVRADMAAFAAIGNSPVQISGGTNYAVALGEHGRVAAWGSTGSGQLGNGTSAGSTRAVEVSLDGVLAGTNIVQLTGGSSHVLAVGDDGRVFTWGGQGLGGQLGNGGNSGSNVPVQAGGLLVRTEPRDVSVPVGEQVAFTAASSGVPAAVQWETSVDGGESWTEVEGATSASYTTPASTWEMSGHQFRAAFTSLSEFPSALGLVVTSRAATLTVDGPPVITVQPPERVTSLVNVEVELTAHADGAQPMTVQWQSSADGEVWSDVLGATENTHAFTAEEGLDGTLFRAVFTNPSGTATTSRTLLEVVLEAPGAHLSVTPTARHVYSLDPSVM